MLDAPYGVSGEEDAPAKAMREAMGGLYDEYFEDALGNQFFVRKGKPGGKKIVLCGHLDEVGFIIYNILPNGYVKILPVGYHDDRVVINQRLAIMGDKGIVSGVTGSIPIHVLDHSAEAKPTKIQDLLVDVGTSSAEETRALGVEIGNYVAFEARGEFLNGGKYYSGKSVDDRSGCAVIVETFRALKDMNVDATVYGVGTVQEEVGCRGARTVGQLVEPTIVFSLDVGIAGDVPGVTPIQAQAKMGKGPILYLMDAGLVGHKGLRQFVVNIAEELEIPVQFETLPGGGTDAGAMHLTNAGAPALSIGIASRYIHSHTSMIHRDDYDYTVKLMTEVMKRLNTETVHEIVMD